MPKRRAEVKLAEDVDVVLAKVRRVRDQYRRDKDKPRATLQELAIEGAAEEVADRDEDEVVESIEGLFARTAATILNGDGYAFSVPSRAAGNQLYVPELDRIVLKDKKTERNFGSMSTVRKTAITTRVLQLVHELCTKKIHVTKRDLFYTDVKLFTKQTESDDVLDDAALMLRCTRNSLNVVASEKGIVVGRLQFTDDGDEIDCARLGLGGKTIPPYIDRVDDIRSDAEFILLVEKDAAFQRLSEDRFYNKYPCIIITAKGQPDVATRLFLKRIKAELCLPCLALMDSDPYGLKILSVYMSGSKAMSYDSLNLATPDIKWLGVRPSDLEKFNIPDQCRLEMTASDLTMGKSLLAEPFIQQNREWAKELETMINTKVKAEIQSLSSAGLQFLPQVYLPQKLREGGWI